jgi:hypothetical protein
VPVRVKKTRQKTKMWTGFFKPSNSFFRNGTFAGLAPYPSEVEVMPVERMRVMNVEIVGDAYSIASNYLRRTGAIADTFATNERLLEIIVEMYQSGEFNKIRLANKAIARFEAVELV